MAGRPAPVPRRASYASRARRRVRPVDLRARTARVHPGQPHVASAAVRARAGPRHPRAPDRALHRRRVLRQPARPRSQRAPPTRRDPLPGHLRTLRLADLPFDLDETRFRMLGPSEHLRAQRFPDDYDTSAANRTETTKGAGNAVPVNVSHWIGDALRDVL
ncbi:hypothetical protein D3248_01670 [Leucobacter zeae]|nr:hypothetical protein [Leucobacter zeae]